MIGAIIGDIAGSLYEFANTHDYNFPMFARGANYTDDTICTVAVADAILSKTSYRYKLLEWCRRYPHPMGAYGGSFNAWLHSPDPQPYNSFGNGAAMRVSPVGFAFSSAEDVRREATASAECSHNHEQGILGANVIAQTIALLRLHKDKRYAKEMAIKCYGDDYASRLPKQGVFDETCQGCVPLALHLFDMSVSFEDAIRIAVSYGGDSDTLGAIVGGLAQAYYGVPDDMKEKALSYLPDDMLNVVLKFNEKYGC